MTSVFIDSLFRRVPERETYACRLGKAREVIAEADYVLVGAGSGLSDAAGLRFSGAAFREAFSEFVERYGFEDLYTSSFYAFGSEEERWAYWARHIHFARFVPPALALYKDLLRLVGDRDYFVITTNVDGQFRKAGFDTERLFEVQGDYAFLQCAHGCHEKRYYNEGLISEMLANTKDCRIPTDLVPHCPMCGDAMEPNLRKDAYFVEDEQWHGQAGRYEQFLTRAARHHCVFLELGVGYNTPSIIRFPFERMNARTSRNTLIRLNRDFPQRQMRGQGDFVGFSEDMAAVVTDLLA